MWGLYREEKMTVKMNWNGTEVDVKAYKITDKTSGSARISVARDVAEAFMFFVIDSTREAVPMPSSVWDDDAAAKAFMAKHRAFEKQLIERRADFLIEESRLTLA